MSNALGAFREQLKLVQQLIDIHGRIQEGPGRRHQQEALYSAGVVMTVAAWQSYVERIVTEGLDLISADLNAPNAPHWAVHSFNMRKNAVLSQVRKFNTPDDVKVRDLLLEGFNFNPWSSWRWFSRRRQWNEQNVRRRTNIWVLVRHSVAHGFALPDDVEWLLGPSGRPRLTLGLLKECKRHFEHLAACTDSSLADHLVAQHQLPQAW